MANITRVLVTGTGFPGAPAINAWYFTRPDFTIMTVAEVNAAVTAVRAFYVAIAANFSTSQAWAVDGVGVQLDPANGAITGLQGNTAPAAVAGTTVAAVGPPQVAILCRLITPAVVDKHVLKGRRYLGPLQQAVTVGVAPAPATTAPIGVALGTLLIAGAAVWSSAVWHRPVKPNPKLPLGRVGTAAAVSSGTVAPVWATQRNRNR